MDSVKAIIKLITFFIMLSSLEGWAQEMPDSLIMELERTYDKERRLEVLWQIVKRTYRVPNYDTTIYFAKKQLDLAEKIRNQKGYVNATWATALSYKKKKDFKNAGQFLLEANQLYERMNDQKNMATSAYHIGQVFILTKDYDQAMEYLKKSAKIYQDMQDYLKIANVYYDIARCFTYLSQFEKSFKYLDHSSIINKRVKDLSLTSKIYNYKGINHYKLKEYEKAIEAYSKAREYAIELDDYDVKAAFSYNNIGEVYMEKKDYQNARFNFEQALDIKRKLGDNELIAGTLINMGKLALLENQPAKSISYFEEIVCILDKDRLSSNLREASVLLAKAYKCKENLTQEDLQKIMALNEQYAQHIHDLKQAGFQQSMISTISKNMLENEAIYLEEKVEKTRNSSLWIAGFSIIIIIGFLILLYYRERKFKYFIQKMWEDIKDI